MKIERTKNATKNIFFGWILKLYQIIIPFIMRTALIYFLGIEYLGLNSLFSSVLQVLNLVELGVGSAMVFSMYKPIAEDDNEKICALMRLYKIYYRIIGAVILITGLLLCPVIPYLIKSDFPPDMNIYILYVINLLATVFSYWLFAYKNSLLQAFQKNYITSKITICVNTIMYLLQFVVLFLFKNYYYYIILSLFGQICLNITTALIVSKMYPQFTANGKLDKQEIKSINQRIRDLFTAKLGGVILEAVDTIVISSFLGLTQLAIYQNYYYIITAVYGMISVISAAVSAGIGNSFETETMDKNYNDFKKFTFIIAWLNNICTCCFLTLYQPFMEIWVGKEYMLNNIYVILFCIYFYFRVLPLVCVIVKDSVGLWHYDRLRPLIAGIVNLAFNIILVKFIGLYGIILSTVISYLFVVIPWLTHNVFKYVYKRSMKEYVKRNIYYTIICFLSCIGVVFLCSAIKISGITGLVLKGLVTFILVNVIQIIAYHKLKEYDESKQLVKRMLSR